MAGLGFELVPKNVGPSNYPFLHAWGQSFVLISGAVSDIVTSTSQVRASDQIEAESWSSSLHCYSTKSDSNGYHLR